MACRQRCTAPPSSFKDAQPPGVVGKLRAVDEHHVGLQGEDLFAVENAVVVAPDAGLVHERGEGVLQKRVFAAARLKPPVLGEAHDLVDPRGARNHQEVEDVVGNDEPLGALCERHAPPGEISKADGA